MADLSTGICPTCEEAPRTFRGDLRVATLAEVIGSLKSAREQLDKAKMQIERLMGTLLPFADHGHPADWRDRPTDEEVHTIVGYPMDHVILVSDLLRAHAVYHDVRKELGR